MTRHSHDATLTPAGGRPRPAGSLGELAVAAARAGGQRPFCTFYGDATGERTELGHATLENWVAKTANLLVDDLELEPGTTLAVRLPTHWTTLVILLAAWRAGVRVVLGRGGDRADASRCDAEAVAEEALPAAVDVSRTLVVGAGFGGRLSSDPGGALAFGEEVLACPDEFDDPPVDASAPALAVAGGSLAHGDLLDLAAAASAALGLSAGTRLLSTLRLDALDGLLPLLAALAADASVVLVTGGQAPAQRDRAASERCDLVVTAADGAGAEASGAPAPAPGAGPRWSRLAVAWDGGRPAGVRVA